MNISIDRPHILIADDHALVRGGLALLIKTSDTSAEITETSDFLGTEQCLSTDSSIDLLLMDLMMPGMDGITGLEHICTTYPDVPVAVISVTEDARTIRQALQVGAAGYIPKTSPPNVTTSAIQLILSGGVYLPPHVLHRDEPNETFAMTETLGPELGDRAKQDAKSMGITPRQKDVLDLLTYGKTNKDIATCLGLTAGTVKMHTSRIFKLLGVSNRTEAVAKYTQLKRNLWASQQD